ncbi:MAG: hypothetical protein RXQ94_05750 [Caldivirga sp.]
MVSWPSPVNHTCPVAPGLRGLIRGLGGLSIMPRLEVEAIAIGLVGIAAVGLSG